MNEQEKKILKNLKNAEGKRLLEKTKLEYSKEIIKELQKNPQIFQDLIEYLEITEEEFYAYISGDLKGNISIYDAALNQGIKLNKQKIKINDKKNYNL